MRKHLKKIVGGLIVILWLVVGAQYYGWYAVNHYLHSIGYENAEANHVSVYLDGVVARNVSLNPAVQLETVYLRGNPLRQILSGPLHVWIKQADIDAGKLFESVLPWPVAKDTLLTVDMLRVHAVLWNTPIILSGSVKQDNPDRAVFDIRLRQKKAKIAGKGEILLTDGKISDINLEFDDSRLTMDNLEAKRTIAWFTLKYTDAWTLIGEINAGSFMVGSLPFLDASLKINGSLDSPQFSFSGLYSPTQNVWVADTQDNKTLLQYEGEEKQVASLTDRDQLLTDLGAVRVPEKPKEPVVKQIALAPPEKTTPKPKADDKPQPVLLSFATAVGPSSPFTGFEYDKQLTRITSSCKDGSKARCWMARGLGGTFGYQTAVMPDYLTRLSNYEQATILRQAMQHIDVRLIKLTGKGDQTETLKITGTSADGRPVHLELSLND